MSLDGKITLDGKYLSIDEFNSLKKFIEKEDDVNLIKLGYNKKYLNKIKKISCLCSFIELEHNSKTKKYSGKSKVHLKFIDKDRKIDDSDGGINDIILLLKLLFEEKGFKINGCIDIEYFNDSGDNLCRVKIRNNKIKVNHKTEDDLWEEKMGW